MKRTGAQRRMGVDTASYFTPWADALAKLGYRTIMRYLNLGKYFRDTPCTDPNDWFKSLSKQELAELLEKGWDVGLVQRGIGRANRGGSAAGERVGEAAAHNAHGLGLPINTTLYCDCEWSKEIAKAMTKQDQIDYIESWGAAVKHSAPKKFTPELYVSPDLKLTSAELYALKDIHGYWKSASQVPTVDTRGFKIAQSLEQWYDAKTGEVWRWHKKYYGRKGLRFDANMFCIDGKGARTKVISRG